MSIHDQAMMSLAVGLMRWPASAIRPAQAERMPSSGTDSADIGLAGVSFQMGRAVAFYASARQPITPRVSVTRVPTGRSCCSWGMSSSSSAWKHAPSVVARDG